MEGRLKKKVPTFVARLMQRFVSGLSASALRTPNETCKVRNARHHPIPFLPMQPSHATTGLVRVR